jgi:hypothetical protein
MKEANLLINKMNPGFKKSNAKGLMHFLNFRFSFDKSRDSIFQNNIQESELHLLSSKKSYLQSQSDYNNNIQAVLGLTLISFFQKDWKNYTVQLSLIRNQIKNKVSSKLTVESVSL